MELVIERPDLSDEEVDALCPNLTQNAAKVRYLRNVLGLQVERRSNGRPLVWRHALLQAKGMPQRQQAAPAGAANQPNVTAMAAWLGTRKAKHGAKAQGR